MESESISKVLKPNIFLEEGMTQTPLGDTLSALQPLLPRPPRNTTTCKEPWLANAAGLQFSVPCKSLRSRNLLTECSGVVRIVSPGEEYNCHIMTAPFLLWVKG